MAAAYEGSRRMLEMAQGQQCQASLLLSSGAVYGFSQKVNVAPLAEQESDGDDYLRESHVYLSANILKKRSRLLMQRNMAFVFPLPGFYLHGKIHALASTAGFEQLHQ